MRLVWLRCVKPNLGRLVEEMTQRSLDEGGEMDSTVPNKGQGELRFEDDVGHGKETGDDSI
jgi:hypothetical protein